MITYQNCPNEGKNKSEARRGNTIVDLLANASLFRYDLLRSVRNGARLTLSKAAVSKEIPDINCIVVYEIQSEKLC